MCVCAMNPRYHKLNWLSSLIGGKTTVVGEDCPLGLLGQRVQIEAVVNNWTLLVRLLDGGQGYAKQGLVLILADHLELVQQQRVHPCL